MLCLAGIVLIVREPSGVFWGVAERSVQQSVQQFLAPHCGQQSTSQGVQAPPGRASMGLRGRYHETSLCPHAGHSVAPEERTHVDTECDCPQRKKRLIPGKPGHSAAKIINNNGRLCGSRWPQMEAQWQQSASSGAASADSYSQSRRNVQKLAVFGSPIPGPVAVFRPK